MLLTILLLNLAFSSLADADADAESSPKQGSEGLENLVEKLESRLRDVETKFQDEKEKLEEMEMRMKHKEEEQAKEKKELKGKITEMETRLEELEDQLKGENDEIEERQGGLKASASEVKIKVQESSRKETAFNTSNSIALTNPSPRDLPIVIISAWTAEELRNPKTVTFESFLANFNNANRPGGGDGVLNLDSGIFTCFTPGYYTVSFSAYGSRGPNFGDKAKLYLYKNDIELPESRCEFWTGNGALNADVGGTSSRILIIHLDAGDTLELRMREGKLVKRFTFNIELSGLGFD